MKFDVNDFNPKNKLSDEAKAMLPKLSPDQIKQLAAAYPNQPRGNAYISLYDEKTDVTSQTFPLSSYQNLANLHRIGKTNYRIHGFVEAGQRVIRPTRVVSKKPVRVVDLSKEDLKEAIQADAEEVKAITGQTTVEGVQESGTVDAGTSADVTVSENPEYLEAKAKYDEAVANKAHPSTVGKLKKAMEALATADDPE